MARCMFCDEWAGPESDRHERCIRDFERQLFQPGLVNRALLALRQAARSVYAGLTGTPARTR